VHYPSSLLSTLSIAKDLPVPIERPEDDSTMLPLAEEEIERLLALQEACELLLRLAAEYQDGASAPCCEPPSRFAA